jgi:hypothetical protein
MLLLSLWSRFQIILNNSYFQITRAVQQEGLGDSVYSIYFFLEGLTLLAGLLCFIFYLKSGIVIWKRISVLIFIFDLIYWLPTGRKEEIFSVLIFPVITYTLVRGKFPARRYLFALFIFGVLIFPVTRIYRDAIGISLFNYNSLTFSTLFDFFEVGLDGLQSEGLNTVGGDPDFSTIRRLCHLEEMSAAVRLAESNFNIRESTYFNFFASFIPRFFWRDKPSLGYGNIFGSAAGLVSDQVTSVNSTILAESFLNLGYFGFLILWVTYLPAFYFYKLTLTGFYKSGFLVLYLIYLKTYIYLGASFSSYYSGAAKYLLLISLLLWVIKDSKSIISKT